MLPSTMYLATENANERENEGGVLNSFIPKTNINSKTIFQYDIFRRVLHVIQGDVIMNWAKNQSNHKKGVLGRLDLI